jgi:hypothetical protein
MGACVVNCGESEANTGRRNDQTSLDLPIGPSFYRTISPVIGVCSMFDLILNDRKFWVIDTHVV